MSGNELPRSFLGQCLRGHVDRKRIYCRVLRLYRLHGGIVPVAFRENLWHRDPFENRDGRRGEDHSLHGAPVLQDGVQDRRSSPYGRDDEIYVSGVKRGEYSIKLDIPSGLEELK